jgi:hypothetical protein
MRSISLIILLTIVTCMLAACTGDHTAKSGLDTVKNGYKVDTAKVSKSNIDTSKVNTKAGDAALDNSASGGTKNLKDTTKQMVKPKK